MPYDDPDPTDPMTLHGVEVQTDDPNAVRDMATCFIEEFARLGVSAERIMDMFKDGAFAGPAMARRVLGDRAIAELIAEQMALRGPRGLRAAVDREPDGRVSLPVME